MYLKCSFFLTKGGRNLCLCFALAILKILHDCVSGSIFENISKNCQFSFTATEVLPCQVTNFCV